MLGIRGVDVGRREVWLAARTAWDHKLMVAARVGVFDELLAQEQRDRTPWQDRPVWSKDKWLDILYKAIKDGDCSADLLRMFVASEWSSWGRPTSMQMYKHIRMIVHLQHTELQERFGVFTGR